MCVPVIPICPSRGPTNCAEYTLDVDVDPASAEPDPIGTKLAGAPRTELVYVSYFTSGGSVSGDTKEIDNPIRGRQPDFSTTWTAPNVAGEVRLWAVVRDSREGVAWWWQDVVVR